MLSSPPTSELSASSVIPVSSGHCHPPPNSPHTSMAPHQLPVGSTAPEVSTLSPSTSPPLTSSVPLCSSSSSSSSNSSLSSLSSQPVSSMCHELSCVGCCEPIRDRYLMCVSECYWHEQCLQCAVCRILLTHSCYLKERKLYCKQDYNKLYAVKCTTCSEPIGPHELVMRVQQYIYHMCCFSCIRCGRQLQKGDEFAVRAGRLVCRYDLALELDNSLIIDPNGSPLGETQLPIAAAPHTPNCELPYSSPHGSSGGQGAGACDGLVGLKREEYSPQGGVVPLGPNPSNLGGATGGPPPPPIKQDGRRGPKRPRTILTTAQRRAFKASFEISQKPCRKVRETLAKETGLSVRIVQVWFQNQRAKLKKIQRKQQQQQMSHGGQGGPGGGGMMMGPGSESGGGLGSHSSDKSKDDSSDDEDDDGSTNTFSLPSMHYMIQSPDEGSYYSTGREEDGYMVKSDMGTLEDSETSLCEIEDGTGGTVILRPSSTGPSHHTIMIPNTGSPMELTCLGNGGPNPGAMYSPPPTLFHSPHHPMMMAQMGPVNPQNPGQPNLLIPSGPMHPTTIVTTSTTLTPIDRLYSMQNSYFNNNSANNNSQSEIEC